MFAGECAVRLPLLAGYLAGAAAWKTAQVSGSVALAGCRFAFTSKARPGNSLTAENFNDAWEIVETPSKASGKKRA